MTSASAVTAKMAKVPAVTDLAQADGQKPRRDQVPVSIGMAGHVVGEGRARIVVALFQLAHHHL